MSNLETVSISELAVAQQPVPTTLLKRGENGQMGIDATAGLALVSNQSLSEMQRREIFTTSIRDLANSYLQREVSRGRFAHSMRNLLTLDDSHLHERVRTALGTLDDKQFMRVSSSLPMQVMLDLGMPDLSVCNSQRMAAYFRYYASKYSHAEQLENQGNTRDFNRVTAKSKADDAYDSLAYIMEMIEDRYSEADEHFDVETFSKFLLNSDTGRLPRYLQEAMEELSGEGYSVAEAILDSYHRQGLGEENYDFDLEEEW